MQTVDDFGMPANMTASSMKHI